MKNKVFMPIISVSLSLILILTVALVVTNRRLNNYKLNSKTEYSKNLSELNSAVNNINLLLYKIRHTSSASSLSGFASELLSESELAKNALGELPTSSRPETLNRFLSQVGNYALSISKSVIKGEELTPQQRENLKVLSDTAATVAEAVLLSDITYNNSEYWAQEVENELSSGENSALADSLTELEQNLTDYPTLVYDGPYSDHIINKEPIFLKNKPILSKEQALEKARELLGKSSENLTFSAEENGKIASYRFSSSDTNISLSKNGGYLVYYSKNRTVSDKKIDYEKAVIYAKDFLEKVGYKSMKETYYFTDNGVTVFNFAFLDGQTICYTDLIKVGVAVDNGEVVFFEASGYLYNHTERAFQTPTYTREQAIEKLNTSLVVKSNKIALIPTSGGAEKRCYEFLCEGDNKGEILVYINVNTLDEEELFILLKSDGGTLVQ